jgi:RNA polymerase sigma-70 factor (ECF subfamily)
VEDVAQEAFLRAFQAIGRFRSGSRFGPWIGRIAVNLCYDRLRQRRGRIELSWDDLPPSEQDTAGRMARGRAPDEAMAARELAERLLLALPARDRQVLVLVDGLGYTPTEAAELAGCSALVLRVRLHRARGRARELAARLLPTRE